MRICLVVGCNTNTSVHPNRSTFKTPHPFRFNVKSSKDFTNEKERTQKYLYSLKHGFNVDTNKLTTDKIICEKYLKPLMFEQNRPAKLLGYESPSKTTEAKCSAN